MCFACSGSLVPKAIHVLNFTIAFAFELYRLGGNKHNFEIGAITQICLQLTVRFLIHGRHARILARIFGIRKDGWRGAVWEGGGGGKEKYSFTVL